MDDSILWRQTRLVWSVAGYRLSLEMALDERASALFESRVADVLRSFELLLDADLSYEFRGGEILRSERGVTSELTVVAGRGLFAVDTEAFRAALSALAVSCREEADVQRERDEEIATEWLGKLRSRETGPPSPRGATRPVTGATTRKLGGTLTRVLDLAVEREYVARNVAIGPVRRVKAEKVRKPALDRAEYVEALLEGAMDLDGIRTHGVEHHRAFIALLFFTGGRISEVLALRWDDVDLAKGSVRVRGTKTEKSDRWTQMLPPLRDDLLALKARCSPTKTDLILPTSIGTTQGKDNARRWWDATVREANYRLADQGYEPIATEGPDKLTPHAARRTFISAVLALGWDVGRVMDSVGHATAAMTLETYRRQVRRGDGALERLAELYGGGSLRAPDPIRESADARA